MSSFRSSRLLLLSCLFCLVSLSFGDYIGAVVQHPTLSSPGSTPAQTKLANLNVYIEDTAVAAKAGAQIVVFPEFGLVGSEDLSKRATTVAYSEYVPDLNGTGTIVPCDDPYGFASSPALYVGSCAAKNNSIVVLINMFEQRQCGGISGCPKDGQFIHVTDVVFDETGALVAKYQKTHPFYIFSVDAPPADQPLVTYKSNFGVVSDTHTHTGISTASHQEHTSPPPSHATSCICCFLPASQFRHVHLFRHRLLSSCRRSPE